MYGERADHRSMMADPKDAEKNEAWLAAIVASSDDAIVSKDLDGIITSWNQGAERLFGYSAEEAIGQPVSILIPPERLNEEPGILDRIRRGERVEHYETIRRRKDGSLVDISLSVSPIITAGGRVIGASKIARDIGFRKLAERKLRESEERFRTMADSAPIMIWMADPTGKALFVNRRFREFFALSAEDPPAFDWFENIHRDDYDTYVGAFKTALQGRQTFQQTVRLRRHDGIWRWFESRGNLIVDDAGNQIGFIGSSTDITKIYESQETLKDLDKRKDEFLATLSHELRNPLAPIRNAVEIQKTLKPASPLLEWSRNLIDQQVGHMARLMEDLLDLSRITRGTLELRKRPSDLREVIHDAVETSRPLIEKGRHKLTIQLPQQSMPLDADPTRLTQLFANLLNNAAKYTERNGEIWLSAAIISGQEESSADVVVSIKDTGIGIEAKMLPHLFDRFVQADSGRGRRFGGLGIGLWLARSIADLHGGSIRAHSNGVGQGSEFIVCLPLSKDRVTGDRDFAVPLDRANNNNIDSTLPARRVLVVDDNKNQVKSLAMLLQGRGFEVRTANDALGALEILKDFVPEFAFIDIGLPGIDGFELARRIRAVSKLRDVVLIAQTGWGREEDREESRQAGFDYHLTKPIDFQFFEKILATPASRS